MRSRLTYGAMWLAVFLFGLLPEPAMRRLGRAAGLIWYRVDPRRRRIARRHMQRLGEDPAGAKEMFASYGRYWAETFWVRPSRIGQLGSSMEVEGLEHLRAGQERGRGIVAVLPHMGNWEAAAVLALDLRLPLVAVAERLPNPHITRWFTRQRAMFGIDIVLTGSGTVTRSLISALEGGKAVALLSDRDLTGRGVAVDFFGERTTLPAGPASLARRTDAVLLPVGIYFRDGPGHRAVIGEPIELSEGESLTEITQRMAGKLEELIRIDPAQWHLVQPNWPSDRS